MNNLKKSRRELNDELLSLGEAIRLQEYHSWGQTLEASMIASAMDAIIAIDETQNIIQYNAAAQHIFGYKASDVMGKPIHILLPEHFRSRHQRQIQRFGETGFSSRDTQNLGTLTGLRSDREIFPAEISISQVTWDGRKLYFAIVRDVSERVKLEGLLIRQFDSLNSLHQITLGLLSQRDLGEMLQFIVDEAAKLLDSPYCEILLPENGELVARAFIQGTPFPSGNRFNREA